MKQQLRCRLQVCALLVKRGAGEWEWLCVCGVRLLPLGNSETVETYCRATSHTRKKTVPRPVLV